MVGVRLEPDFRAEIEAWALTQEDMPGLAEAIRRLLRQALGDLKERKPSAASTKRVRAKMSAPAATAVLPKKTRPRRP
jgi:hypothetical protein